MKDEIQPYLFYKKDWNISRKNPYRIYNDEDGYWTSMGLICFFELIEKTNYHINFIYDGYAFIIIDHLKLYHSSLIKELNEKIDAQSL